MKEGEKISELAAKKHKEAEMLEDSVLKRLGEQDRSIAKLKYVGH